MTPTREYLSENCFLRPRSKKLKSIQVLGDHTEVVMRTSKSVSSANDSTRLGARGTKAVDARKRGDHGDLTFLHASLMCGSSYRTGLGEVELRLLRQ
ncbi:hypothetical protein ElyMa_001297700 [Elysia marginata]|uniref:Uncharacterized protein n=1 Tax=Elysia marginata TaxID=1093978 RepID=A0AAV4IE77_9GAST|nr:hypothetical protein ElyMa_001297700 [Elysia marginata]